MLLFWILSQNFVEGFVIIFALIFCPLLPPSAWRTAKTAIITKSMSLYSANEGKLVPAKKWWFFHLFIFHWWVNFLLESDCWTFIVFSLCGDDSRSNGRFPLALKLGNDYFWFWLDLVYPLNCACGVGGVDRTGLFEVTSNVGEGERWRGFREVTVMTVHWFWYWL